MINKALSIYSASIYIETYSSIYTAAITIAENSVVIFRHNVCISVTMYVNAYVSVCIETF